MSFIKKYKQLKINIFTLFISIVYSHLAFGQIFSGSQNPPGVKFQQINTPSFQIIFPTTLKQDAERMANLLDRAIAEVSKDFGHPPRPISIILQDRTVESNGFVQMAPRRAEFYTMPPQEFDTQDWLNSLAIHELRHVVQFDELATGLRSPLFEELKLALFGIQLPPWFFEGDAVLTETLLSPGGRGRQPQFDMVFRTNILSGHPYSYSKNYFGSFKDFTPGYYPLGYFMTTKLRKDNPQSLPQIFERISSFPLRPYNFSSSLKKYNGYHTRELFKRTVSELDSLWQDSSINSAIKDYEPVNPVNKRNPSNYLLPYQVNDSTWVTLKSSKAYTPQIVLLASGKEKRVLSIGSQIEANLSYASGLLTWDEYRADRRYGKQSFNVVCLYNLAQKKFMQLTHYSKLFSPALSSDGQRIIAVKVSAGNQFNLVELDPANGKETKIYPNPENYTLQTPAFNAEGSKIIVTAVNQEGKTLLCYDATSLSYQTLLPPQRQMIARPQFMDSKILYKAHYNGTDNLFALDTASKKITQVSFSKFGAFYPSFNSKTRKISFSDYQYNGYDINTTQFEPSEQLSSQKPPHYTPTYFQSLKLNKNEYNLFQDLPEKAFTVRPYREIEHLFYFHSIRPSAELNNFPDDMHIGFDFVSDNKLNTLSAYAGYQYNSALHSNEFRTGFIYQKFYPVLKFDITDKEKLAYATDTTQQQNRTFPFSWRETVSSFSVEFPFFSNRRHKNFSTSFNLSTSYTHRYQVSEEVNLIRQIAFPIQYQSYISYATQRSARDLIPQWGIVLRANYQHLPFEKKLKGQVFSVRSVAYTPGLFPNHGLQLSVNWQHNKGVYQYTNDIPRASGYRYFAPVEKIFNSMLLNYRFPIFYPDWEIGPLAYIKRWKGSFFSDFENVSKNGGLKSFGFTLGADMNLLRFYLPDVELAGKFIVPVESTSKKPILELGMGLTF